MVRYRQGVEVVFRPAGLVYAFDIQHFINVLIGAFLLTKVVVYLMDFITFNLLPNGLSTVLYAKRAERVSKVHSFAQLGLRAAVAVNDFKRLDIDSNGFCQIKDLVAVFGAIPSVTKENAEMMAATILRAANKDTGLEGRLSFNEFMSLFDGTTALDFDRFVELVHTTGKAKKLDEYARQQAQLAYDQVEAGIDLKATARSSRAGEAKPTPTLNCFVCRTRFGFPDGAKLVKCPHCQTPNPTAARPEDRPAQGFLGGFGGFFGVQNQPPYQPSAPTTQYPQSPTHYPAVPIHLQGGQQTL